jgi:metal-responsive CopG/Arc/MetJ family transcriptional regulator
VYTLCYMPVETDALQMIHMRVAQRLLKKLDDFRFKHRFKSRSEAVRWLMKTALDAKLTPKGE